MLKIMNEGTFVLRRKRLTVLKVKKKYKHRLARVKTACMVRILIKLCYLNFVGIRPDLTFFLFSHIFFVHQSLNPTLHYQMHHLEQ